MKREFEIGDIAHLNANRRIFGMSLKYKHPIKITGYKKIPEGWIYYCTIENKGKKVEGVELTDESFIPKWS